MTKGWHYLRSASSFLDRLKAFLSCFFCPPLIDNGNSCFPFVGYNLIISHCSPVILPYSLVVRAKLRPITGGHLALSFVSANKSDAIRNTLLAGRKSCVNVTKCFQVVRRDRKLRYFDPTRGPQRLWPRIERRAALRAKCQVV